MDAANGWALATGAVTLALLAQTARAWWSRWRRTSAARSRARRAAEGEREAEALLESRGFAIEGRQVRATLRYELSGAPVDVEVRADLLVERAGARYVAEVKTGRRAPQLRHGATRRQLLEYAHAFAVDGVLLVDADRAKVDEVTLPSRPKPPKRTSALPALLLALAFSCAVVWLLSAAP